MRTPRAFSTASHQQLTDGVWHLPTTTTTTTYPHPPSPGSHDAHSMDRYSLVSMRGRASPPIKQGSCRQSALSPSNRSGKEAERLERAAAVCQIFDFYFDSGGGGGTYESEYLHLVLPQSSTLYL